MSLLWQGEWVLRWNFVFVKRMGWIACWLVLLLGLWGWAAGRFQSVGVVLAVHGRAVLKQPNQLESRAPLLKTLSLLHHGDTVSLEEGATMTASIVATGQRYKLTGPVTWEVRSDQAIKPGSGVEELPRQSNREALVASQKVDLSKFGGVSNRGLGVFFVDSDQPAILDLRLVDVAFEANTLNKVRVQEDGTSNWTTAKATLIHHSDHHSDLRVDSLRPAQGKAYWVSFREGNPDIQNSFKVVHFDADTKAKIAALEEAAVDLPGQIELYEGYLHYRLYGRADALLAKMARQHPEATDDWPALLERLTESRIEGSKTRL